MSSIYLVLDDSADWQAELPDDAVITFDTYLKEHPIKGQKKTRIINLCNTDRYLSKGYYCSLLAEARGHQVLPSVNTLNDLSSQQLYLLQVDRLVSQLKKMERSHESHEDIRFKVFFGKTEKPELRLLARKLFERFPCPILDVELVWQGSWQVRAINPFAFNDLQEAERARFMTALEKFTQSLWRNPRKRKASRWEMAILVNPKEKLPPSDDKALKRMERAATKVGFHVEFIGPADYARLSEFDALFIRETTGIDHHTY